MCEREMSMGTVRGMTGEGVSWCLGERGGRKGLTVATEVLDEDLHCLGGLGRGGAGAREGHHVVGLGGWLSGTWWLWVGLWWF